MMITNRQLGILADIFFNTERPDKVSVTLDKTKRDLTVEYRDLDDEWFKELSAALESKPPSLKEQALGLLNEGPVSDLHDHEVAVIRRAIESLSD